MSAILKLGRLRLKRRDVDPIQAMAFAHGASRLQEPHRTVYAFAALGLCCTCDDWPELRAGQDYAAYARDVRSACSLGGADPREALSAALRARDGLVQMYEIDEKKANEYADFFGVPRPFSSDSDSPRDTKDPPSEG